MTPVSSVGPVRKMIRSISPIKDLNEYPESGPKSIMRFLMRVNKRCRQLWPTTRGNAKNGSKTATGNEVGIDFGFPSRLFWWGLRPVVRFSDGALRLDMDPVDGVAAADWEIHPDVIIESHGHSIALFDRQLKKIGEAYVDSDGPVSLTIVDDPNASENTGDRATLVRFCSESSSDRLALTFRNDRFVVRDRGVANPDNGWRRWSDGCRSLTYLLDPPRTETGKSHLLVVFSALGSDYDFTYNYRAGTADVDSYRLFILDDFGHRGSYYLADHRDDSIYQTVQCFIRHILDELNIELANTSFSGSSKGGTAALIHGLPMRIGKIIVGAPQYRPGSYLYGAAPGILEFITGDSQQEGRVWLNNYVESVLSKGSPVTRVMVLVGADDHHLKAHVLPLQAKLLDAQTPVETLVIGGVDHQTIGKPFSSYLRAAAAPRKRFPAAFIPYDLSWKSPDRFQASLKLWIPQGEAAAVRVYSARGVIARTTYSEKNSFLFRVPKDESVRVRIYRRDSSSNKLKGAFTTSWLRPATLDVSLARL